MTAEAAENSAISYVKSLSDGLGTGGSESSEGPRFFDVVTQHSEDYYSDHAYEDDPYSLGVELLRVARRSGLVASYGTTDDYNPKVDYFETDGLRKLYPCREAGQQGWYTDVNFDEFRTRCQGGLVYYNSETETLEDVGSEIFERFQDATYEPQGVFINYTPRRTGSGVFVAGGVDSENSGPDGRGRLVGFMVQNVAG